MRSAQAPSRLREADDRILDPETIEAKMDGLSGDQKDTLWKFYRSSRARLTDAEMAQRRELISLFKRAASDIETEIFQTFRAMGSYNWDLASMRRVGRDQQLLNQIRNRIVALGGQINSSLSDGLLDQFKKTWLDGAHRLDAVTPESVSIKFGLLPDREILALLDEPFQGGKFSDRLGLITDDMAHRIKQELIRSMMSGESWQDAARRVRKEMGTAGQKAVWRAEMVARTELARAQTLANQSLYDENDDVIDEVVWVAHPGACEEICLPKHGKPVEEVGYPVEDSHPNCVCDILAIPKGTKSPISPISRAQWARDNGLSSVVG